MNPMYKSALQLHQQIPVVDAHNDLAGELLLRHRHGETNVIQNLYLSNWKEAGFQLIVSSIYIENDVFYPSADITWINGWQTGSLVWEQGFQNALEQIQVIKEEIHELSDELCLITSHKELEEVKNRKKIGILLYMEGLDCIGSDLSKIHKLYELGVRGASLTWSRPNLLATGCCTATRFEDIPGCITELGLQAIQELEQHHMFLDISHLNNEGWQQLQDYYKSKSFSNHQTGSFAKHIPYVATHSNSYRVHANYRNLTDHQIQCLAAQGGIMGFNACKYIVGSNDPKQYPDAMCEHIEHAVSIAGAEHVGLGFDLCDSYTRGKYQTYAIEPEDCLENHKKALLLTARLLERGMSEQTVLQILGLNWLQYLEVLLH